MKFSYKLINRQQLHH